MRVGTLMTLEVDTWKEILIRGDIEVASEEEVYSAVLRYANQFDNEPSKRLEILETLLPCVRFPLIDPDYLVSKVETDESLKGVKILHSLLHEAYRYKTHPVHSIRTMKRRTPSMMQAMKKHNLRRKVFEPTALKVAFSDS